MGDFNSKVGKIPGLEANNPQTNKNQPLFMNFISEVNLFIINTLPLSKGLFTRFMSNSSHPDSKSLLDYGLTDGDHVHTVSSFVIDESARYDCGSDHALLECEVVFGSTPHVTWAFTEVLQYDFKDDSDFTGFQTTLDQKLSSISLPSFSKLKTLEMLPHITESIKSSALHTFGLKIKNTAKRNINPLISCTADMPAPHVRL